MFASMVGVSRLVLRQNRLTFSADFPERTVGCRFEFADR